MFSPGARMNIEKLGFLSQCVFDPEMLGILK
jgi:hypothetical protein